MKLMITVSNTFYRKILNIEHILENIFHKMGNSLMEFGFFTMFQYQRWDSSPF